MTSLDDTIAATQHQPADGVQYVDATEIVHDLRRDLRRLRRCLSVQSVMLAIILILNLVAPIAVVVSR